MARRTTGEYKPTCSPEDCIPAPATRKGWTYWCRHGRRFALCGDGGWEPILTPEEGAQAEEENRPRTAAWEAMLTRMGLDPKAGSEASRG